MRRMTQYYLVCLLVAVVALCPMYAWGAKEMQSLPLGTVNVGGEIGRRIDLTIEGNILKLNVEDHFIKPLSVKNGSYVGIGILLDSVSRLAEVKGDERLKTLRDRLAEALMESQDTDGYIGYKKPADRVWKLFDPDEIAQIVLGLTSYHRYTGDEAALTPAKKLADFEIRTMRSDPQRISKGLADVLQWIVFDYSLLTLFEVSHDTSYLDFCQHDRHLPDWTGPIVLGRWGNIEGHVYGHLAKCMGLLRLYHATGDAQLLAPVRRAVDFSTRHDGMVISGAVSEAECWHDSQYGSTELGETCATCYLLLVLDELLRLDRDSVYGDLMERIIYNTLFGAQSEDGRKIRYYTAFEGPRAYFPTDIYCCANNFRRAIASLPELVYYRVDDGVAVNLYGASTATVPLKEGLTVTLQQETDYPRSGNVTVTVKTSQPGSFPLWFRIPSWCKEPKVMVNGEAASPPGLPGRFYVINREWKTGDQVVLDFPMAWRWVKGRQAQAGRAALMRGPMVFCLNPSRQTEMGNFDLHDMCVRPGSLEEPLDDDSVRPGGIKARLSAAPLMMGGKRSSIELTEFPDPAGEAIYFRVENPCDPILVDDELLAGPSTRSQ